MTPKEIVREWVARFNAADAGGLAELYAESAVNHQVAEQPVEGRGAIREMFAREFARATMVCIVENLFEDGEWAILEWRDPLGLRGCGFFHVQDDRIVFQRGYWDKLTFLRTHAPQRVQQVVPFFSVGDMERSRHFYIDLLGSTMKHRWIDGGKLRWCWLELGDAALMLQEQVVDAKVGLGVSLNFICGDAIALFREFRARGVDAKTPFVGNRMWVTQVIDPDGYHLFFESPTDEPEESVYSGD